MDDLVAIISAAITALTLLPSVGRLLTKFIRGVSRRRRARLWAPVVVLTEQLLRVAQATQLDVKQLSDKIDASFGQTNSYVADLRNDVRNWSFQMFTLEALRRLLGSPETQESPGSRSAPESSDQSRAERPPDGGTSEDDDK